MVIVHGSTNKKRGVFLFNSGFTLPEILITLMIVGVIAALSIIPLIENQQKTFYIKQLKKAYAEYNNALINLIQDYGCNGDLACTGLIDDSNQEIFGDQIVKYFNVAKNCKRAPGCFTKNINKSYDGSGSVVFYEGGNDYRFMTTDGMNFRIHTYGKNCGQTWWSNLRTNQMTRYCGDVLVDVNGHNKGPNNFGRDIFRFYMINFKAAGLYPAGGMDDKQYSTDNWWKDASGNHKKCHSGNTNGEFCLGRIIEEGWQMNY